MWYHITKYSFDPTKSVFGPFKTEEDAWSNMEQMADEEYRIDTEENDWRTRIIKDKDCGEITIKNFFTDHTDVTEFFLFEI
jgi:hypothetical protein